MLRTAIADGARFRLLFDDPVLAPLAGNPEFASLREEMQGFLAEEKTRTLEMICKHNPIPDYWQPLASTCDLLIVRVARL